ncbi:MAG TPA: hypothetical protein VLH56_05840 [Dissulfurispiraceae bacterium]|nr:hypothetical protein [Dissulfurispiraceae bacterium]
MNSGSIQIRQSLRTWANRIALTAMVIVICLCIATLLILNSPAALNAVAGMFGYEVHAENASFSPLLSGEIKNLSVKKGDGDGFTLLCENVNVKNALDLMLKGHVDTIVLEKPKLSFRLGKKKSDFSFLNKLPDIRLLDIRNAEAVFTFEGNDQKVTLNSLNFSLKNFSPKRGGELAIDSLFSFADSPKKELSASGHLKVAFRLAGAYPPYGTGTADLILDNASYTLDGKQTAVSALNLTSDMAFDRKTETFTLRSLKGISKQFGVIQGAAKAVLRGDIPWQATLAVSSIDFSQAFAVAAPVLPDEYRTWTMQGKGVVETSLSGTYAKEQLAMQGTLTFSFSEGGFSSPDAARAAQGVSGKVVLKLQFGPREQKLAFSGQAEVSGGEYLWGKFYSNLAGRKAALSSDGSFFLSEKRLQFSSTADIFETATAALSFDGTASGWKAALSSAAIRNDLAVNLLLRDFLETTVPTLKGLSAAGATTISAQIERSTAGISVRGMLDMRDASLLAPGRELTVEKISLHLPLWLLLTPDGKPVQRPPDNEHGTLEISGFQKGKLKIDNVKVPLYISRNYIRIAEPVSVPLFGGGFVLYRLGVDDIPHPSVGFRLGVRIESVDLGQLTKELFDNEYAGTIFADTGILHYRTERLEGDGQFLVRVFGGEISFQNFFFEKMFSAGRSYGGDIAFSGISLEQVTQKVPVGHATGIIHGSLRNFVMEYGQPANFDLEVQSVDTRGVKQRISMDAIESITVLGTGVRTSVKGGLTSLFRDFPYSKIGLKCSLRNDVFTIRGTVQSGGKEYIVKRGWLRGVDVINQNQDNRISFQDMQERLERIMKSEGVAPGIPEVN